MGHAKTPQTDGRRTLRTLLLSGLLLAGLAGLPIAGAGPAVVHPSASHGWVNLTVSDQLTFAPNTPTTVPHSVTFEVRNVGTTDHTFTVSSRVNQTAPSGTDPSGTSGTWFDAAHVLVDVTVPAGQTVFANATFPTDGTYQFICRFHYPSMTGTLTVGASPSSGSSSSPPWLLYGAVLVVVVVIVAAVLALRMRRSPPAAPAAPPAP